MSSKIFHENLSFIESFIILFFLFCLSNISLKLCFEEFKTTAFVFKLFFIKLIEFGKTENTNMIIKLVNNVLIKLQLNLLTKF